MSTLPRTARRPPVRRTATRCQSPTEINETTAHRFALSCGMIREITMRLSSLATLAHVAGASSRTYVSIVSAASECSRSMELADWGENSTGDISVASGQLHLPDHVARRGE